DLEVVKQSVFPVVHEHARRDVHRGDQHQPFLDAALLHDCREIAGDAHELLRLFRVEVEVLRDLHSASEASAFRSAGASAPARTRLRPAAAIIAALSVESDGLGRYTGSSRAAPRATSSARSRLFADTPPAMPTLCAPNRRAASNNRSIKTVTTTR